MRALLVALLAAASLGGCSDVFTNDYEEGLYCASDKSCPPGQACALAEGRCRRPCTVPGLPGECATNTSSNGGNLELCDFDGFCRPACGSTMPMCGGGNNCPPSNPCDFQRSGIACNQGGSGFEPLFCDNALKVCRPAAGSKACPPGSISITPVTGGCPICRPPFTTMDAGTADGGPLDGGAGG